MYVLSLGHCPPLGKSALPSQVIAVAITLNSSGIEIYMGQFSPSDDGFFFSGFLVDFFVDLINAGTTIFREILRHWYEAATAWAWLTQGFIGAAVGGTLGPGRNIINCPLCVGVSITIATGPNGPNLWYNDPFTAKLGFCRRFSGNYVEPATWINTPQQGIHFGSGWGDGVEVVLPPDCTGTYSALPMFGSPPVFYQFPPATGFSGYSVPFLYTGPGI